MLDRCIAAYKSGNEKIVTVNASGLVKAVASGSVNVTVSYTTAPGSANLTGTSAGKVPVTFRVNVPVTVR